MSDKETVYLFSRAKSFCIKYRKCVEKHWLVGRVMKIICDDGIMARGVTKVTGFGGKRPRYFGFTIQLEEQSAEVPSIRPQCTATNRARYVFRRQRTLIENF